MDSQCVRYALNDHSEVILNSKYLYLLLVQLRSAGFGFHPFPVHTALILPSGTRPGSHL